MTVGKRLALVLLAALLATTACGGSSPAPQMTATSTDSVAVETPSSTVDSTATAAQAPTRAAAPTATAPRVTPTTSRSAPTATRGPATPWGSPLPTLAGGQTYKDPQGRFSFTIPSNWTQVSAAGAEIAFQSPPPAVPGAVPATVNVVLEKLPSASVTLDEYDKAGEANLKQQFTDYKLISLEKVTVDGRPAYRRIYTATIANRLLQLEQVYLIERDTAYIISCGATQDTFATYTTVFSQISGTFTLGVR